MNLQDLEEAFSQQPIRAPLQQIDDPLLEPYNIQLFLKREDLIHPHVSGNKWRKLKYNLLQAAADEHDMLLTFGGAYSNHILATAHAGQLFGFRTIGIIRGEAYSPLNAVLAEAHAAGMALHYMARWRYRQKGRAEVQAELAARFGRFYMLPEGGTNTLAVRGCQEIIADIDRPFDVVCCSCGTGGTLAGVVSALVGSQQALGFAVLKGEKFLKSDVQKLLAEETAPCQWDIIFDYHFNGYAKTNGDLLAFITRFESLHNIRLDPIYTGKLMLGLYDMIQQGYFKSGQTIIAIHTGKL